MLVIAADRGYYDKNSVEPDACLDEGTSHSFAFDGDGW